jgi:hypothetical protein
MLKDKECKRTTKNEQNPHAHTMKKDEKADKPASPRNNPPIKPPTTHTMKKTALMKPPKTLPAPKKTNKRPTASTSTSALGGSR